MLLLTLMAALTSAGATAAGSLITWGIPLGLIVSCGLAIASGFCSFFPPLAWIAVAWVGADLIGRTPGATAGMLAIYAGTVAAAGMLVLQGWRVRTGRFRPTLRATDPET